MTQDPTTTTQGPLPHAPEGKKARAAHKKAAQDRAAALGHHLGGWAHSGPVAYARCPVCGRTAVVNHRRIVVAPDGATESAVAAPCDAGSPQP